MRIAISLAAAALLASTAVAQVTIPPHASTYNGYSRGYYFVAQTSFIISQLQLPPEAFQAGDTGSFLVRVNGTTALRSVGVAGGVINPNLLINNGDAVDIIGNWSPAVTGNFTAHNSYTASMTNFVTNIEGVPHTIQRNGWQWDIGDANWATAPYLPPTTGAMGRILMTTAPLAGFASAVPYGAGCYDRSTTYYEDFPTGTFDLGVASGVNSFAQVPNGQGGYALIPGSNAWFTPVSTPITLTDDSVSGPQTLPFTFQSPAGSTTQLWIGSNGMVFPTSATTTDFTPTVAELLGQMPRYCPLWRDLNPGAGGTVNFDVDPSNTAAYVTFTNVPNFTAGVSANTFQVAFFSTGMVEYRYQVCDAGTGPTLTGYSTGLLNGNPASDPGSIDLTTAPGQAYNTGPGGVSLALASSARPVSGTTIQLGLSNIPGANLGAVLINFSAVVPGIDLGFMGAPGCLQHIALGGAVTLGFTVGNGSLPFQVPASTRYHGTSVAVQGAAFVPGANALGVTSSNGVLLTVNPN